MATPVIWHLTDKGHAWVDDYDDDYEANTSLKGIPSRNYYILSDLASDNHEVSEIDFSIPSYSKIPATTLRRKLKELESKGLIEKW